MSNIVAGLLTVARKLDNYEIYTGTDVYWVDTTHYRATVPAGKRWWVFGGVAYRENSSSLDVYARNTADKLIQHLATHTAATGHAGYPLAAQAGSLTLPYPLDTGEYIQLLFGAAQSTAAYATCVVLEIDI